MDEQLVKKAQDGDAESFAALVDRFKNMAMGYAYWFCNDFHLAEDMVQNAFFEAYRELHKLQQPAAFPGWFRRILFKNCDRLTRGKRLSTVSLESAEERPWSGPSPAEKAEERELEESVEDAIHRLPDGERKVVMLYYISGYSQREVAAFLDMPETTVNSRLHSARARLKERMLKMVAEELKKNALPKDFGREFNPALAKALDLCKDKFGDDLKAIYLTGSVAACEALAGASDVNWFMFIDRDPDGNDASWCEETARSLEEQFPQAREYCMSVHSMDTLRKESFWRFILKYNSVRLYGSDILQAVSEEGFETPEPTKELAKGRLWFVEECIDSAVRGKLTKSLTTLPVNPFWATRKLARYFVVVEGAYVLMADGSFNTFHQEDVLAKLKKTYPQWQELLELSERILKDPVKEDVLPHVFIEKVEPFVRWAIEHVRSA